MKKTHNLPNIYVKKDAMTLDVNMSRINNNLNRAQYMLDSAVMDSMVPYMPKQAGTFIDITRGMSTSLAGSGKVVAAAPPMGRFLYNGKTMVDEITGSPYARKGAKKVLVSQFGGKTSAKEKLNLSAHENPNATDHWFEKAKEKDFPVWRDIVKKQMQNK